MLWDNIFAKAAVGLVNIFLCQISVAVDNNFLKTIVSFLYVHNMAIYQ